MSCAAPFNICIRAMYSATSFTFNCELRKCCAFSLLLFVAIVFNSRMKMSFAASTKMTWTIGNWNQNHVLVGTVVNLMIFIENDRPHDWLSIFKIYLIWKFIYRFGFHFPFFCLHFNKFLHIYTIYVHSDGLWLFFCCCCCCCL